MTNHVTPEELLKLCNHITVDELDTIVQAANRKTRVDFLDAILIAYTYGKVNAIRDMRQNGRRANGPQTNRKAPQRRATL